MTKFSIILALAILLPAGGAHAVRIADVTTLRGERTNVLTGMGLVFGLKGTGDGGDYAPAIGPLAAMLSKFSNKVSVAELSKAQNVAIVNVTATVPASGARQGDHLDVHIASAGAANTLKGGRLFVCPLQGPVPGAGIFALCEGPVDLEDPTNPNVGVVHGGAVMEEDLRVSSVENDRFSLIIEAPSASYTTAHLIAKTINGAESVNGEELAVAIDGKEVVVQIPPSERDRPDSFISRVQQLPVIMIPIEARVTINRSTQTVIVTGDVEIGPVVINHQGLTITTVAPPPAATPTSPIVTSHQAVALDTANQGGARLQDLVTALDQLRVPVNDRIAIYKQLYYSGKLHAKLEEVN